MKSYPLLQSQLGIFLDWMSNPSLTRYNLPCLAPFPKSFDADKVQQTLQNILDGRRVLHTRFLLDDDGQPRQYTDPGMSIKVQRKNMTDEAFEQYVKNDFVRPYDLLSGEPLCRCELVECPSKIYVLFEVHHIIGDGLTLAPNITIRDLADSYNGQLTADQEYGMYEYAEDEQKALISEAYERAKQYYAEKFGGRNFTTLSPLPADCLGNSIHEDAYVSAELVDKWCKEHGTSSNLLFMAAFSYVTSVMSREDEVVYSTINHGRMDKRLMGAYGMFVKSTPVLAKVDRGLTAIDFIKGFRGEMMSTIRYGAYPFNHFCRDLKMQPTIEFGFQGVSMQEYIVLDGVKIFAEQLDRGKSTSNLTCIIYLRDGQYDIRLSASDAIFNREKLQTIAKAINNVVANMMAEPETKLENLSVMNKEDEDIVGGMRSTAQEDIPWKLYYQPIEENAVKYADRTALIAKDRTLTFAEFNAEANRVAHALIRKGVKRGDRVVLLLPRRSGVIVSMFGVSKAGAAYIPCDPEYPADRINLIMNDSEAQYVITTPEHAADYPAEKVILIDDIYNTGNSQPGDELNPNVEVSPEDLAYLIYTSGSTGRPKGVMLRHVGIANYLYPHPANVHIQGLIDLGVKSFVSITTLSFDMSLKEFAGSLFNGITSVLADEQEVLDAKLLSDLMARTGAEAINGTCSRIASYMELPAFCQAISHCKAVWAGGEQFPQQLLTQLQNIGVHIFNTYGPTEITVSSNIADLTHAETVSVGRPLLNYIEYVVDPYGNELPVGFVGELFIGGPGVARGYNNLPEMTQERFVEYKGERVYRSGDLARW
ncbi:MAG: AMP-binding protein [Bacteroidales bacterium]|nr:AMP-binding protein [Bacteroidales bacterium]